MCFGLIDILYLLAVILLICINNKFVFFHFGWQIIFEILLFLHQIRSLRNGLLLLQFCMLMLSNIYILKIHTAQAKLRSLSNIRCNPMTRSDLINCYGSCYMIGNFFGSLTLQLIGSDLIIWLSLKVDWSLYDSYFLDFCIHVRASLCTIFTVA